MVLVRTVASLIGVLYDKRPVDLTVLSISIIYA